MRWFDAWLACLTLGIVVLDLWAESIAGFEGFLVVLVSSVVGALFVDRARSLR